MDKAEETEQIKTRNTQDLKNKPARVRRKRLLKNALQMKTVHAQFSGSDAVIADMSTHSSGAGW